MGGLGLMMRRRAFQANPTHLSPLEGVEFFSELVSDGASYIIVPDFRLQRWDSIDVAYSTIKQTNMFLFGSRWNKSTTWLISTNSGGVFFSNWFDSSTTHQPTSAVQLFGENRKAKTDVAYSSMQGGLRRIYYQNDSAVLAVAIGNEAEEYIAPLYIFASNQANSSAVDSRILTGSISSFIVTDYDGRVKLDLKPCKYMGEPGMWDSVSQQFFSNAGSGNFSVK